MKRLVNFISAIIVVLCLASCGGNQSQQTSDLERREAELQKREDSLRIVEQQQAEQRKQAELEERKRQEGERKQASRTFTTNTGVKDYERALNYCYTLGYKDGSQSRENSMPSYSRERDMKDFEGVWTSLYGIPSSTDEAKEAYNACFEKYKKGHDEAFYKTN